MAFELHPRLPFRLDLTAWALRRRARNLVDAWDGRYRRALIIDGEAIVIEVSQHGPVDGPDLAVNVSMSSALNQPASRTIQKSTAG
ncbi:MAG: hypothetical protein ABI706_07875 [Ilumatobacteraceae bacterium]